MFKNIKNLDDINTTIEEGKLLLISMVFISTSSSIIVNGDIIDGTKLTPEQILEIINNLKENIF